MPLSSTHGLNLAVLKCCLLCCLLCLMQMNLSLTPDIEAAFQSSLNFSVFAGACHIKPMKLDKCHEIPGSGSVWNLSKFSGKGEKTEGRDKVESEWKPRLRKTSSDAFSHFYFLYHTVIYCVMQQSEKGPEHFFAPSSVLFGKNRVTSACLALT